MRALASKWLLAAYNVAAYLFLLAPIAIIVVLSFSDGASLAFPPSGFSLRWFRYLAGRDEFIAATMVSLAGRGDRFGRSGGAGHARGPGAGARPLARQGARSKAR